MANSQQVRASPQSKRNHHGYSFKNFRKTQFLQFLITSYAIIQQQVLCTNKIAICTQQLPRVKDIWDDKDKSKSQTNIHADGNAIHLHLKGYANILGICLFAVNCRVWYGGCWVLPCQFLLLVVGFTFTFGRAAYRLELQPLFTGAPSTHCQIVPLSKW